MVSSIHQTSIDCANAEAIGEFWAKVLGFGDHPEDRNSPGDEMWLIVSPDLSQRLLFITVPEGKAVKNRLHFDLQPQDCTRDEEVERLLALGASLYEDHRRADGSGWVTLTDPEGNELCVERSAAERAS